MKTTAEPLRRHRPFTKPRECGALAESLQSQAPLAILDCNRLYLGHGDATMTPIEVPIGTTSEWKASCIDGACTLSPTTAAESSPRRCTATGCAFGPAMPISNSGISSCVRLRFAAPATGTMNSKTGFASVAMPLTSEITVTGNAISPCPKCVAGTCGPTATNAGAACVDQDGAGSSSECLATGVALSAFPIGITPLATEDVIRASSGGARFCPGQSYGGAFGAILSQPPAAGVIAVAGKKAGALTPGTHAASLASVFCVPATGNALVDGAMGFPGPGAVSLPASLELKP